MCLGVSRLAKGHVGNNIRSMSYICQQQLHHQVFSLKFSTAAEIKYMYIIK